MNTMRIPGFTAEAALYLARERYRTGENADALVSAQGILPQLPPIWVCWKCLGSCTPDGCSIGPCFKTVCM